MVGSHLNIQSGRKPFIRKDFVEGGLSDRNSKPYRSGPGSVNLRDSLDQFVTPKQGSKSGGRKRHALQKKAVNVRAGRKKGAEEWLGRPGNESLDLVKKKPMLENGLNSNVLRGNSSGWNLKTSGLHVRGKTMN